MDTNTAAAVGIVGFIMGFFFIAVIWYVLCLIARWKVFESRHRGMEIPDPDLQ